MVVSTVWIKYFKQPMQYKMHCITGLQALCAWSISNFQKASQRAPLNLKMHSRKCLRDSKMGARSAWGDTNYSQECPKLAPRCPQEPPNGGQEAPKTPLLEAKRGQVGPKRGHVEANRWSNHPQELQKCSPGAHLMGKGALC